MCACVCVFACYLHVQVWAVSGEPRDSSGGFQESSPHRLATPAALPQTPLTTRSAQVIHSAPPCMHLHIFSTYASLLHFDVCYLILLWVGRTFLREISRGSGDRKNAKQKEKDTESERVFLSTALSSSRRLPFICSQLLRMHCSRWAAPPVPTPP